MWFGLGLIVFFFLFLVFMQIRSFDLFWYDREFKVIEKHQGGHEYKGRSVFDYYIEVSYVDDKESNWVEEVSGNKFFAYDVGSSYTKRDIRDESMYNKLHWITIFFILVGCVFFSSGITPES